MTTSTNDLVIPDTITIDAVGPMPLLRPATAAEVGEVVRRCAAEGTAVYPVGGGTMLDYGLPPARPGVAVQLRALDKVIDFPASDMTITVEAGITIARLSEITRAEGLHLPIDVPDPERATLGGAIACNVSGPRRYGYGTFRDYILGITTINDRGECVSAGGRVVKNVAGYDLMKLHTGALGTLGIITQVTLKLRPVPEDQAIVTCGCPDELLDATLDQIHRTATRPTHIELTEGRSDRPDDDRPWWSLFVGFEGNEETVVWQFRQLMTELVIAGIRNDQIAGRPAAEAVNVVEMFKAWPFEPPEIEMAASLNSGGVAHFCRRSASLVADLQILSYVGNGAVRLAWPRGTGGSDLLKCHSSLLAVAERYDGNVIIKRCPSEWKKSLPIWGRPPADLALQKAVKRSLDPQNIFNPGRFVTDAF